MLQWKIERLKKRETCLSSCVFVPFCNTLPEKEDKDNTTNVAVNCSHNCLLLQRNTSLVCLQGEGKWLYNNITVWHKI